MANSPRAELRAMVDGAERVFPLDGEEFRIGRGMDNDIVLPDFSVSRNHARLFREGGQWVLLDEGSTNGLRVNGKTARRAELHGGDHLEIGTFGLQFRSPGPATPAPRLKESLQDHLAGASIIRPLSEFTAEYG
ncbi:MAG: FHA domain-containing protein, partial [Acidobacteria bacterium]|nr:FHA domain-containing protein [Acidobacteriota bacterium]